MSAFRALSRFAKIKPRNIALQRCVKISSLTSETRIGLIGLGNVGSAIAKNILKSDMNLHAVFDTNPEALDGLEFTVKRSDSAKHLAEDCEVVLTALPTPASVKKAMEDENGVLAGIQRDSVWIDHSTTGKKLRNLILSIIFKASLLGFSGFAPLSG